MFSNIAIEAKHLSKHYQIYNKPSDRLKQFFARDSKFYKDFTALEDVSFTLPKGEILGIVGKNGSGKSTLLQIICGTITPSSGSVKVIGRIAALLELGAGFNMEFTGHENIFLYASILGVTKKEIEALYDDIIEFSELSEFIHQPVKTYSSGMYVRLAFSIAVNVKPEILIIDEALSVGDGAFSRKSFNRIMALKEQGKTILFCSHNMYQIEALCNKAIWLDHGGVKLYGNASDVVSAYNQFLEKKITPKRKVECEGNPFEPLAEEKNKESVTRVADTKTTKILKTRVTIDGVKEQSIATSRKSNLYIRVDFQSDKAEKTPVIAFCLFNDEDKCITSSGTHVDKISIARDENGFSTVDITYPKIPLLKGNYYIDVYLIGEDGIFIYEHNHKIHQFKVIQDSLEQGLFSMAHLWNDQTKVV